MCSLKKKKLTFASHILTKYFSHPIVCILFTNILKFRSHNFYVINLAISFVVFLTDFTKLRNHFLLQIYFNYLILFYSSFTDAL